MGKHITVKFNGGPLHDQLRDVEEDTITVMEIRDYVPPTGDDLSEHDILQHFYERKDDLMLYRGRMPAKALIRNYKEEVSCQE